MSDVRSNCNCDAAAAAAESCENKTLTFQATERGAQLNTVLSIALSTRSLTRSLADVCCRHLASPLSSVLLPFVLSFRRATTGN